MNTNRTNWTKLSEHETESFTHTLRYFTLLGRSWFWQYISWKWCAIETLFCILLCCYLNSTIALCKFSCIWWEFKEFTHWLGGCIDGVWSPGLVATRFGGFTYLFYNFMTMLIENKGTIIILWNAMLISGDTFFCISRKDDFNLNLAWHYRHVKPPKRVATRHPPSQCVNSSNSHQMQGNLHSAIVEFR